MKIDIIKNRKIFYGFSIITVLISLIFIFGWGIKFGIDFTGGSIIEFNYSEKVDKVTVDNQLKNIDLDLGSYSLRETAETGYILRTKNIDEAQKNELLNYLSSNTDLTVEEVRFSNIGPTLGSELKNRALASVAVVVLAIVLFVAYVFRHVSKPVSSLNYGFITIIAFLHDVIIPIGVFAILGHFGGVEVDTLFVIAILVVLGYSINDTIVIFDRVRENISLTKEELRESKFEKIVSKSLKETIVRSINTSLTTILALLAIYIFGGETTKYFALAMIVGVLAGTYSSIFLAAPLLITFKKYQDKRPKKVEKVEVLDGEKIGNI